MPEWLIERGIGEIRAALVEGGEIIEARIALEDVVRAGSLVEARLIDLGTAGRNAIARDETGMEYLLPRGSAGITQGARLTIEVMREQIPGSEPWKRPLARMAESRSSSLQQLKGRELVFPSGRDELADAGWNDLIEEARSSVARFAGGELRISPTPAMTLIDVDGYLPPNELAVRGASMAAKVIRRLDIGGSIGIDLPTAGSKDARQAAAAAIDSALAQPFERTAVNGFGFVQIVRPRIRASLVELAADRPSFEARWLLRRAAGDAPGPKRLVANPSVIAFLEARPGWLAKLESQAGGRVSLRADPTLPISSSHAEPL